MSTIVSVHSYPGGTGKSNLTANLASCVVQQAISEEISTLKSWGSSMCLRHGLPWHSSILVAKKS
jgi:hypothetical protein